LLPSQVLAGPDKAARARSVFYTMLRDGLLLATLASSVALHATPLVRGVARTAPRLVVCSGSSGQGFGGAPKPTPPPKKKKKSTTAAPAPTASMPSTVASASSPMSERDQLANAEQRGRKLLEEMRQGSGQPAFKKNELVLTEEEKRPLDPTEGVMPEEVANRMLARILPFAGAPILLAVFVFIGFWYANTIAGLDLPPQIVAYVTQALLLLSFAGITYGVMSTNLEEGAEQTLMGADNLQRNLDVMRGAEDARIATAKLEQEEADALADGVVLSRAAAAKRDARRE